ncbi:MAG: MBL fold metallo-hydrolase [Acidimicrobiales bacterium]|jgi:glyoxylase-like metal-dependent hydrolase (beta-lactamase superfamily II)|nr:MBL fold metallo-hydrolase [Acidimicrobiales bacterium]
MHDDTLEWQVGEVTITSVPESSDPTSPKFMFSTIDKEGVLELKDQAPWLAPFVGDKGHLLQKIHCCVIDTGSERIAVDTCVGNDKQRGNPLWHEQQGPFLDRLSAAGYPPETITHVVCTHLHVDHVGWNTRLVDGQWVPTFPNAEYVFVNTEFDHWASTEDLFGDPVFEDSVAPINDAGLANLVDSDHVIGESVSFEATPGHTPGHISVRIESAGQQAIITGDMAHSPIQIANPDLSSSFDTDPDAARDTRVEAFARWADGKTLVIGTHFGTPTAGTMHPDGDTYRLDSA